MAVWTTKYVNSLPDSSFAWIDSSGNRHLPYKDANGKVDLPHVRNALARLNQVKGLSGEEAAKVRNKLQALLPKQSSKTFVKQFSELNPEDDFVQLIKVGDWPHPLFGVEHLTLERCHNFKKNFDDNVLGHKVTYDYEHKRSSAHGTKAAAELVAVEVREDGLYGKLDYTPQALKEIEDGEWLYTSPEYVDVFTRDGTEINDVIVGGGLTNNPVIHGIAPINCSTIELEEGLVSEYADWEHSEPGTGEPPAPATDITKQEPPPPQLPPDPDPTVVNKGDTKVDEKELRESLGIGPEDDLQKALTEIKADAGAYREAQKALSTHKTFSDAFPDEAKRMHALEELNRDNAAKAFSAAYVTKGIPPVAVEEIEKAHKTLSTVGGVEALTSVLDAMPKIKYNEEEGTAVVDGTDASGKNLTDDPRKAFAVLQSTLAATETDGDMRKAFSLAVAKNPELFEASQKVKLPQLS